MGYNALMIASMSNSERIVEILLQTGADMENRRLDRWVSLFNQLVYVIDFNQYYEYNRLILIYGREVETQQL